MCQTLCKYSVRIAHAFYFVLLAPHSLKRLKEAISGWLVKIKKNMTQKNGKVVEVFELHVFDKTFIFFYVRNKENHMQYNGWRSFIIVYLQQYLLV